MPLRASLDALHAYVPGEQPRDPEVVKLNTNENPYPPSPKVMEALAALLPDALRKYPDPTARPLREALAALHGLAPDQILAVNGSDEGLALCTRAFCERGGRVGYLSPSYSLYPVLADIAELEKVEYPLDPEFGWTVPERVDVDLFFLTQPNAPTSLAMTREQVEILAARCPGVVVVDEAYVDFSDETMLDLVDRFPNVLVSRTFSKSYSLAGLRVGWLAGPEALIEGLNKIRDSYNLDAVAQALALAAVSDHEGMRVNADRIRATRKRVADALTERGFRVLDSRTNFLFARVPEGTSASDLFAALKDRKVFVRYFPGPLTGDWLRITVGTDPQMDRFLTVLDDVR